MELIFFFNLGIWEAQRERASELHIHWFTSQCLQQLWPGQARPKQGANNSIQTATKWLQPSPATSQEAGTRIWKWSTNPDILIRDAGILTSVLTTIPNTYTWCKIILKSMYSVVIIHISLVLSEDSSCLGELLVHGMSIFWEIARLFSKIAIHYIPTENEGPSFSC